MGTVCGADCLCSVTPEVVPRPWGRHGTNHVQLVISSFFNIGGIAVGYHTSVVVDGVEYFFETSGICKFDGIHSHGKASKDVTDCGFSPKDGEELAFKLAPHFSPGSYDFLLKNCNTFTDCALYFLLGVRLDKRYSLAEKNLREKFGLDGFEVLAQGLYKPNINAAKFAVDDVITTLSEMRMTLPNESQCD